MFARHGIRGKKGVAIHIATFGLVFLVMVSCQCVVEVKVLLLQIMVCVEFILKWLSIVLLAILSSFRVTGRVDRKQPNPMRQ
jgi:hypothetical protein